MSRHHVRLNAARWRRVRREVFERDGWRCRECGKAGRLECDHVEPLEHGGAPWDMANLQTLCRTCHIEKTKLENLNPMRLGWDDYVKEVLSREIA